MKHSLLGVIRNKTKILGPVVITAVNRIHSNLCDPSYVGKCFYPEHDLVNTSVAVTKFKYMLWFNLILTTWLMLQQ